MDAQTRWLLKQPAFWIQLAVTITLALVAFGLVPTGRDTQLVGAFLMVANAYGFKGHVAQPPRVPLSEMSEEERQKIFDQYPDVKARWEASQQKKGS